MQDFSDDLGTLCPADIDSRPQSPYQPALLSRPVSPAFSSGSWAKIGDLDDWEGFDYNALLERDQESKSSSAGISPVNAALDNLQILTPPPASRKRSISDAARGEGTKPEEPPSKNATPPPASNPYALQPVLLSPEQPMVPFSDFLAISVGRPGLAEICKFFSKENIKAEVWIGVF